MAIETLIQHALMDAYERRDAIHQPGCKITKGAGISLPAPSFALAMQLVLEKRASSRILAPIAAGKIQLAYRARVAARAANMARQSEAATALQTAWRCRTKRFACAATAVQMAWRMHAAQMSFAAQRRAQARIAAVQRGRLRRRAYRATLLEIRGPLAHIQAAARGYIARRHLKLARAGARLVQSTFRRVRAKLLRRRLARAANALRQGGKLAKYRQRKGGKHERHQRFAWVSEDLQHFMWAPVQDRLDEDALKLRSIPMASITAVTEGVKTPLLKKMEKRAAEPQRMLSFSRAALAVDTNCAFSVICRERVIDFYAPDQPSRDRWLRDLKTALTYGHTYDHNAAMAAVEKLAAEATATKVSDSDSDDMN